jgi:signal peptidase
MGSPQRAVRAEDTPFTLGRAVRQVGGWVVLAALVGLLAVAASATVVPRLAGGLTLTVLSPSMEPALQTGDLIVTRPVTAATELATGDIVAFLPWADDPTLVTHRIIGATVGRDGLCYITQGDNNDSVDPWGPVCRDQLRGVFWYKVPWLGQAKSWLAGRADGPLLVAGAGGVLVLGGIVWFATTLRRR